MRKLGADVRIISGGYAEAEVAGIEYARTTGATWVSPYNDGQVIAGQATVGVEILEQLPPHLRSTWLIPTGGGGLISGIGIALERAEPRPRLVGVQSTASPFLHAIFYTGTQDGIVELPSLADGLAGPVEDGSVTIPLVRRYVDDIILVTEQEIVQAIVTCWNRYGEVIEGSSAVTLAALMSGKISQRPVVALVSGGNIQPEMHAKLIQSWDLVNKER
jgi:threonine dehydratase